MLFRVRKLLFWAWSLEGSRQGVAGGGSEC